MSELHEEPLVKRGRVRGYLHRVRAVSDDPFLYGSLNDRVGELFPKYMRQDFDQFWTCGKSRLFRPRSSFSRIGIMTFWRPDEAYIALAQEGRHSIRRWLNPESRYVKLLEEFGGESVTDPLGEASEFAARVAAIRCGEGCRILPYSSSDLLSSMDDIWNELTRIPNAEPPRRPRTLRVERRGLPLQPCETQSHRRA